MKLLGLKSDVVFCVNAVWDVNAVTGGINKLKGIYRLLELAKTLNLF